MGSIKLDRHRAPGNFHQSVEKFYHAAFGPSPSLYRQISLCGWRPLASAHSVNRISEHRFNLAGLKWDASGIDIYETPEGMTIEVALSKIKEDSLHLAIAGKMVIIRGEKIIVAQEQRPTAVEKEHHAQFNHQIPLPENIKTGGFRAQLQGDVVRIDFAKSK